ncbi:hypothetical protein GQ54DRAFT_339876 [Martensiomyces pterosporus]|nr:hypothetical protein GQ54DRAFT_339876 [Martensiomyces pterosporus]
MAHSLFLLLLLGFMCIGVPLYSLMFSGVQVDGARRHAKFEWESQGEAMLAIHTSLAEQQHRPHDAAQQPSKRQRERGKSNAACKDTKIHAVLVAAAFLLKDSSQAPLARSSVEEDNERETQLLGANEQDPPSRKLKTCAVVGSGHWSSAKSTDKPTILTLAPMRKIANLLRGKPEQQRFHVVALSSHQVDTKLQIRP